MSVSLPVTKDKNGTSIKIEDLFLVFNKKDLNKHNLDYYMNDVSKKASLGINFIFDMQKTFSLSLKDTHAVQKIIEKNIDKYLRNFYGFQLESNYFN